jgi:hypothetical protein
MEAKLSLVIPAKVGIHDTNQAAFPKISLVIPAPCDAWDYTPAEIQYLK